MEIWKKMWVGVFFWTQCINLRFTYLPTHLFTYPQQGQQGGGTGNKHGRTWSSWSASIYDLPGVVNYMYLLHVFAAAWCTFGSRAVSVARPTGDLRDSAVDSYHLCRTWKHVFSRPYLVQSRLCYSVASVCPSSSVVVISSVTLCRLLWLNGAS